MRTYIEKENRDTIKDKVLGYLMKFRETSVEEFSADGGCECENCVSKDDRLRLEGIQSVIESVRKKNEGFWLYRGHREKEISILKTDLAEAKQRIEEQKTEISDMTMRRDNLQLEVEEIKERASKENVCKNFISYEQFTRYDREELHPECANEDYLNHIGDGIYYGFAKHIQNDDRKSYKVEWIKKRHLKFEIDKMFELVSEMIKGEK